jgi:hypothetical protein
MRIDCLHLQMYSKYACSHWYNGITVILLRNTYIWLFWAALGLAIFQLHVSGGNLYPDLSLGAHGTQGREWAGACHHYQWQGCKFRPMLRT